MTITNKSKDFFISEHKQLLENLNKISDDLLKAKWHFLASIATIGLAYSFIFHQEITSIFWTNKEIFLNKESTFTIDSSYLIFFIAIIGNIIFWLIAEYIISHAFLFRFIQAKAAQKEHYFSESIIDDKFINDPSALDQFVVEDGENLRLNIDFFIPDQFIPIYWASIWLIIINTIVSYVILGKDSYYLKIILTFICLSLIFKLITYIIYKINKFINSYYEYTILLKNYYKKLKNKDRPFFSLPHFLYDYIICGIPFFLIGLACYALYNDFTIKINIILLLYSVILSLFWIPILAIVIHFSRFVLQVAFWDLKGPKIKSINEKDKEIVIDINYCLFSSIKWMALLLFSII